MEEQKSRNEKIYMDWKSGKYKSMTAIANKRRLTRQRVHQIIRMYEKKNGLTE